MRRTLHWLAEPSRAPNWAVICLAIVTVNWIVYWMGRS